jgi:hypothetical protein
MILTSPVFMQCTDAVGFILLVLAAACSGRSAARPAIYGVYARG